jgi:hypothetical protein
MKIFLMDRIEEKNKKNEKKNNNQKNDYQIYYKK